MTVVVMKDQEYSESIIVTFGIRRSLEKEGPLPLKE